MHSLDSKKVQKRLAKYVKQLPSESVAALAETDDQIKYLTKCQIYNRMVGDCWYARCSGQDDPLQDLLFKGKISAATHEGIYSLIRFFQALWGVVQVGWIHIKTELGKDCQFKSAQHLFEDILRVWFDSDFAQCLQPHHELTTANLHESFADARKYTDYMQKGAEVSKIKEINPELIADIRNATNLSSHMGNFWLVTALSVCTKYAHKNMTLQSELDNFYYQIANFCKFGETWSGRKRGSKRYPKLKTIRFIDGHRV